MSCKAPIKSSPPTNKPTSSFLQAGCPSCQPTNSVDALKENITSHELAYPKLTWGLLTLSLTTNSSWLPWGRVAMPLISPLMAVVQLTLFTRNYVECCSTITRQEKTKYRDFSLETEPKLDQFLKTVTITSLVMTIWHYRNSIIIIITYYTAVACIILQLDSTTYWQVVAGGAFWTLIVPIHCLISYRRPRYSAPPCK